MSTSAEGDAAREARILDERARVLAASPAGREPRRVELTVAIVDAGGERFGIPCQYVREICRCPRIAKLPGVPPWCRGLVQFRGDLMTVLDLPAFLGLTRCADAAFLAVVAAGARAVALVVDGIGGLRDVYADDIAEALDGRRGAVDRMVRATTKDLVSILSVHRLLDRAQVGVAGGDHAVSERPQR